MIEKKHKRNHLVRIGSVLVKMLMGIGRRAAIVSKFDAKNTHTYTHAQVY